MYDKGASNIMYLGPHDLVLQQGEEVRVVEPPGSGYLCLHHLELLPRLNQELLHGVGAVRCGGKGRRRRREQRVVRSRERWREGGRER